MSTLVIGGTYTNPPAPPPPTKVVGLFDLGTLTKPACRTRAATAHSNTYIVDVSKDGAVAGGTDASGNAFIWTSVNGKVAIGAGYSLVGVDWYNSTNVLAVANNWGNSVTRPWYWQGYYNGTNGFWTQLPGAGASTSTAGYWFATGLGVATDNSDWWVSGYTTNTIAVIINRRPMTTPTPRPRRKLSGFPTMARGATSGAGFMGASDSGAFVGTEEYGGSGPTAAGPLTGTGGSGRRPLQLVRRSLARPKPATGPWSARAILAWPGPFPATAISRAVRTRRGTTYSALWWDTNNIVHKLPCNYINGTTY